MRDPLDVMAKRPKVPVPASKQHWIIVGPRMTPHGGWPRNTKEMLAACKLMEENEKAMLFDKNENGAIGEDHRWPHPLFLDDDGIPDPPLTKQQVQELQEVFGVTEAEWIELYKRG